MTSSEEEISLKIQSSKEIRLYNILFPIWLLIWIPSYLWLFLIPANYLIDRLVLSWSLRNEDSRKELVRKNTWKVCIAGFAADLAGSLFLLAVYLLIDKLNLPSEQAMENALGWNPFTSLPGILIVLLAVLISGLLIFLLDRSILCKAGLDPAKAKKSALTMAVCTAPYLFLIPSSIIY